MADDIESTLKEVRVFPPPDSFAQAAHIKSLGEYRGLYEASLRDPEGFWAQQAETLRWSKKWDRVLEWNPPFAKWFASTRITTTRTTTLERCFGSKANSTSR